MNKYIVCSLEYPTNQHTAWKPVDAAVMYANGVRAVRGTKVIVIPVDAFWKATRFVIETNAYEALGEEATNP